MTLRLTETNGSGNRVTDVTLHAGDTKTNTYGKRVYNITGLPQGQGGRVEQRLLDGSKYGILLAETHLGAGATMSVYSHDVGQYAILFFSLTAS